MINAINVLLTNAKKIHQMNLLGAICVLAQVLSRCLVLSFMFFFSLNSATFFSFFILSTLTKVDLQHKYYFILSIFMDSPARSEEYLFLLLLLPLFTCNSVFPATLPHAPIGAAKKKCIPLTFNSSHFLFLFRFCSQQFSSLHKRTVLRPSKCKTLSQFPFQLEFLNAVDLTANTIVGINFWCDFIFLEVFLCYKNALSR